MPNIGRRILYTTANGERQTVNIELLKIFVDRALKYEKDNGFKPNGSPIKK
jgi:hypothetical protein